jgi:plastocyanin
MSDDRNRQSLLLPVMIPLGALAVIGVVLFGFSRVLLQVTATAAWVTALIAAAGIMAVASYVASRRSVSGGSIFSMVGAVAGIAMLTGGVALFAAAKGEEGEGLTSVLIVAPQGAAVTGFAEETRTVTAPAGEAFQILFDNQDTTAPHNVVLAASDAEDAQVFLQRPPFVGPDKVPWPIEALEEGSYFFFCEVHPTAMFGTLEATQPTTVVAENLAFDTNTITLAANTPTPILFQNRDAGIPHNLSIYGDEAFTDAIVVKEPFAGPGPETYEVPALDVGTYYFRCDVHPTTMIGKVVVEGAAGATGGQPEEPTGAG